MGVPCCLVLLLSTPLLFADYVPMDIKWDNGFPDLAGLDWQSDLSANVIVADDFQCLDPHPVTDVQWWGSLLQPGVGPQPDFWRFSWWTYVAGVPGAIEYSHPGNLLLMNDVYGYTWQLWHDDPDPTKDIYHYYVHLPSECRFHQEYGNIYFLAIQAGWTKPPPPATWGWHESVRQWNDDAVSDYAFDWAQPPTWWDPQSMEPIERPTGTSRDMAFQLGIPEPATGSLLGLGLLALAFLRRRRS